MVKEIDYIGLHPVFSDFALAEKDPRNAFPYKMAILPGNYSEYVGKVLKARGFTKVLKMSYIL